MFYRQDANLAAPCPARRWLNMQSILDRSSLAISCLDLNMSAQFDRATFADPQGQRVRWQKPSA
jgi:hypothetical protein